MKEFNLKVGDTVYCYKNSKYIFMSDFIHKKNNTYKIKSVLKMKEDSNGNEIISIILKNDTKFDFIEGFFYYWIIDKNSEEYKLSNINHSNFYLFEDYFLSQKEYRKLKLENLNEII